MDTETTNIIEVEQEALTLRSNLSSLTITSQDSYNAAVTARVEAKAWLKEAEAYFDALIKPAYVAYKNILEAKKKIIEPVEGTVKVINGALIAWDTEQERIRRVAQAKLEEEARQRAEEEWIAKAVELEAAGASAEAVEQLLEEPVVVTEIAVAEPTYQKSGAVAYRNNYSAEVTDIKALIKWIAKNPTQANLVQPNQSVLNSLARSLKETMDIPGVRLVNNKVPVSVNGPIESTCDA